MNKLLPATVAVLATLGASSAYADRLDDVKARGFVQCGVTEGVPGFSELNAENDWAGLEVDFCRAVAASIFNDPKAVRFTTLTAADRWQAHYRRFQDYVELTCV